MPNVSPPIPSPRGEFKNSRFTALSKWKTIVLICWLILSVAVTIVYGPRVSRWMEVDRCLDAGGRFNYQTNHCEGARF